MRIRVNAATLSVDWRAGSCEVANAGDERNGGQRSEARQILELGMEKEIVPATPA